ncbi:hypothetical protein D0Y65_009687 [Glycine soja]|uniref:Uncharacterized protein n=1 Tax=Glycine soja TaxID=3848 RepID=A0A445L066_GLYSO|nr:hypothetical protein D0Y65_009687 [Glycine soja]
MGGKCAESPPTFIRGKRWKNRKGKKREMVAAQLAQASWVASTRRHRLLLEPPGRPKWAWIAQQCFLSTSGMSRNFTDCLMMGVKYLEAVKRRFGMKNAKHMATPMSTACYLDKDETDQSIDVKQYRELSGGSTRILFGVKQQKLVLNEKMLVQFEIYQRAGFNGCYIGLVNVDPATGKADGPHKKKLRTYLEIVARDKVDVTYDTWKEVPTAQKDLIWEDIQTEFEIPEASDGRTKKKILQIVGERWRQFKFDLTRKWALAADKDGVDDIVCEKYGISKEKWAQFCQTRRDPSWEDVRKKAQASQKQNTAPHVLSRGGYEYLNEKLMDEKTKKRLEEAA